MSHNYSHLFSSQRIRLANFYGGGIWFLGWCLLFLLDGKLDLPNLGMLLLLTSALAAMCFSWQLSAFLSIAFVLAFDWFFIPPRHTFSVDFQQYSLMLWVMLAVNLLVIILVSTRRSEAERAGRHASEADFLRRWSDKLHAATTPFSLHPELQHLLNQVTGRQVTLLVLKDQMPAQDDPGTVCLWGEASMEQRHALWHCMRNSQQLGRGTGYYEIFSDVYLPLRTGGQALGAVLVPGFAVHEFATRVHLQAICDQFGQALETYRVRQQELASREQMQTQLLRNNLLAAISHDYRTPLATIIGAASSLQEQADKLDEIQRVDFLQRILDEAGRLTTITTNILQLARLDADKNIRCDWQSVEEIAGDLKRRWRGRGLDHRIRLVIPAQLPLLWCDIVLMGQLIDNLVDNAFKYSPMESPIIFAAEAQQNIMLMSVSDAGPGISMEWQEKIFLPFQRGPDASHKAAGAGVGLALCRAIVEAHAGKLQMRNLPDSGCCFEILFPLRDLPSDANLIIQGQPT